MEPIHLHLSRDLEFYRCAMQVMNKFARAVENIETACSMFRLEN
jgi:hypothetical protein